ncbi:hypothetical protein L7F22_010774 [Adiantum nelumboides]|nr:hypothetical protein [Adiantum nelumboides]
MSASREGAQAEKAARSPHKMSTDMVTGSSIVAQLRHSAALAYSTNQLLLPKGAAPAAAAAAAAADDDDDNEEANDSHDDELGNEVDAAEGRGGAACSKRKLLFAEILQSLEAAIAANIRDAGDSSSTSSSQKSSGQSENHSRVVKRRTAGNSEQEYSGCNFDL